MHKLTVQFYLEEVTHVVGIKEERGEGAAMERVGETATQARKNWSVESVVAKHPPAFCHFFQNLSAWNEIVDICVQADRNANLK